MRRDQSLVTYGCQCHSYSVREEKFLCNIILPSVDCLALQYFLILSLTQHDFRKQYLEHKNPVVIFSTNFFLTLFLKQRDFRKQYLEHKNPVVIFSTIFLTLFLKQRDFRKQYFEHKNPVVIFSTNFFNIVPKTARFSETIP